MSAMVDKSVRMSEEHAVRLQELAAVRHATEDSLIEEGIDLLFQEMELEDSEQQGLLTEIKEAAQLRTTHEANLDTHGERLNLVGARFIVGTPVPAGRLRRIEDPH